MEEKLCPICNKAIDENSLTICNECKTSYHIHCLEKKGCQNFGCSKFNPKVMFYEEAKEEWIKKLLISNKPINSGAHKPEEFIPPPPEEKIAVGEKTDSSYRNSNINVPPVKTSKKKGTSKVLIALTVILSITVIILAAIIIDKSSYNDYYPGSFISSGSDSNELRSVKNERDQLSNELISVKKERDDVKNQLDSVMRQSTDGPKFKESYVATSTDGSNRKTVFSPSETIYIHTKFDEKTIYFKYDYKVYVYKNGVLCNSSQGGKYDWVALNTNFGSFSSGQYSYEVWINDKKVDTGYFTIQ